MGEDFTALFAQISTLSPVAVTVCSHGPDPGDDRLSIIWRNERALALSPLRSTRDAPDIDEAVGEILLLAIRTGAQQKMPELIRGDPEQPDEVWSRVATPIDEHTVIVFATDITRQVEHEQARDEFQQQLFLAQRMEAVGRLAGGVAHDFNNIITVIQSYAGFLRAQFREGDPALEDIDVINEAGERAALLTRQLLAFSRKQIMELRLLDMNAVVTGLARMVRRVLGETIQLETILEPKLGTIRADLAQMEQVIMNLLVNARDAMPDGGKVTIETSNVELTDDYIASKPIPVPRGNYVRLTVSDTGVGMNKQLQLRVFDPFFTTKPPSVGTGLGLAVAYGIVKQTQGFIWIYSELGIGTTFKIYLPRISQPPGSDSAERALPPHQLEGTETILLVEDDEALRRAARRMLLERGYTVLEASEGAEALLLCERYSGEIHCLLTDVVMPHMSGREVADRVSDMRPDTCVVYMSGYADHAIVRHGILDEGVHFVHKPFNADTLLSALRLAIDAD